MFLYELIIVKYKIKFGLTKLEIFTTNQLILKSILKVFTVYGIVYLYSLSLFIPGNIVNILFEFYIFNVLIIISILSLIINLITVFTQKPSMSFHEYLVFKIFHKQ